MASAKQASLANNQDTEPRALSWQAGNQDLFLFCPCPAPAWKPSVLQEDYSISSPKTLTILAFTLSEYHHTLDACVAHLQSWRILLPLNALPLK